MKLTCTRELQPAVAKRFPLCNFFVALIFISVLSPACNSLSRDNNRTAATPSQTSDAAAITTSNTSANVSNTTNATADTEPGTRPRIVAFGDSLTAGYGLAPNQSYPALLQQKLDRDGYNYEVVNVGVSGDTSAGGVRRIDWALSGDEGNGKVEFVILELGANDILRGQSIAEMRRNLATIIEQAQGKGATVLLAGMESPPNFGRDYQQAVHDAFRSLAGEYKVAFIPFFLDRVAGQSGLNQPDGVHPNAEGTRLVADTVYAALRPLLDKKRLEAIS